VETKPGYGAASPGKISASEWHVDFIVTVAIGLVAAITIVAAI
jgi:hypothetical protein